MLPVSGSRSIRTTFAAATGPSRRVPISGRRTVKLAWLVPAVVAQATGPGPGPPPPLPPAPPAAPPAPVVTLPAGPPVTGEPAAPAEVVVDPAVTSEPTVDPAAAEEVALFAPSEVEQLSDHATHAPQSSS